MEITKEFLQSEKEKYIKAKEQHLAEANVFAGAAQLCEQLIERLEGETGEQEAPNVKDPSPPGTEFEVKDRPKSEFCDRCGAVGADNGPYRPFGIQLVCPKCYNKLDE